MSNADLGLGKEERLKGQKIIGALFQSGKQVFVFPYKLVYMPIKTLDNSKVLFSVTVPKRKFKKAVDRNHIKRQIREAYRNNKPEIPSDLLTSDMGYALMYIYIGDHDIKTDYLSNRIRKLHTKWIKKLEAEVI